LFVRHDVGDPLAALLIDTAIAHTKADLELIDNATARFAPLAEQSAREAARTDAEQERAEEPEQESGQESGRALRGRGA
jgi:hypothetical protein